MPEEGWTSYLYLNNTVFVITWGKKKTKTTQHKFMHKIYTQSMYLKDFSFEKESPCYVDFQVICSLWAFCCDVAWICFVQLMLSLFFSSWGNCAYPKIPKSWQTPCNGSKGMEKKEQIIRNSTSRMGNYWWRVFKVPFVLCTDVWLHYCWNIKLFS